MTSSLESLGGNLVCSEVSMYSLKKKYSKPDLEMVNKILSHVPENKDKEDLNMLVANIHFPTICYSWKSEEDFNNLLSKYKIDVSVFEKEKDSYEKKTENNELFNMIVDIISKNPNEYKKEIISTIKNKLPK